MIGESLNSKNEKIIPNNRPININVNINKLFALSLLNSIFIVFLTFFLIA